ncbi:MAG: cation diffusion facilitator family transporter [Alphaproteobacteria bacterium]|nr:cation diffusion facilitator family transporter [Alphaproteobacteria bacterium]
MTTQQKNNLLKKSAAIASIATAILLMIFKLVAFLKTDSLAIFSSFIDSATDLLASAISFIAVYFSTKNASIDHRYGYGKSEALSALLQALFVGGSGVFVIIDGLKRLIHPVSVMQTNVGIVIMVLSIFATLLLVLFQTYVANKTNSLAIKADRAHYTVDFLTNSAVIISLLLVHFTGFMYFDVIAALFISVYLLYNAYSLAKEAVEQITDKELSPEIRKNIEDIVRSSKGIHGMHDFRTRNLGDAYYFELHLEIDGTISLLKAHELTEAVEQKILELYPESQILIHQDPYGIHEDRLDHKIEGACKLD